MLYWAMIFFIFSMVAAILGFGGIAAASAGMAQILFFIFLALFALSMISHFVRKADSAVNRNLRH